MATTAKIKQVREQGKKGYTGKNGEMFVHMVTLEEPIDGIYEYEYHSKSPTCSKFVAGQDATFTTEKRVNGNYTNYKIMPAVATPFVAGGAAKGGGFAPKDEGRISALSAASSAANFYSGKLSSTPEQMMDLAERIYQFALSKSGK
jgi:hypothetical protein